MSSNDHRSAGADRETKAVLICPECGHTSAVTGDWHVHEANDRTVIVCPVCDEVILERQQTERMHADD